MKTNDREALADLIRDCTMGIESKSGETYNVISLELIEKIGEHFESDDSLCFYEMRCQHGPDGHDIDIPAWCARARGESVVLDTGEVADGEDGYIECPNDCADWNAPSTECPCHCHA